MKGFSYETDYRIIVKFIHLCVSLGRLSVSNDLRVDAERDLRDIGAGKVEVYPLNKVREL